MNYEQAVQSIKANGDQQAYEHAIAQAKDANIRNTKPITFGVMTIAALNQMCKHSWTKSRAFAHILGAAIVCFGADDEKCARLYDGLGTVCNRLQRYDYAIADGEKHLRQLLT
jgi:hypothetical protein